jgi:allantoin racemase
MFGPIVVINPNSSEAVTAGIARAVARFSLPGGPAVECVTLHAGPAAVQTQRDIFAVALPLLALAERYESHASAIVIACYSDPALHLLRECCAVPVFGIGESALLEALACGERFGVIGMSRAARSRHLRSYGAMGVLSRFAGELAAELTMEQLQDHDTTLARLTDVGRQLIDQHHADVLIMGCAGLADYRAPLQIALGVPVIDPCQATLAHALGRVCLNRENLL